MMIVVIAEYLEMVGRVDIIYLHSLNYLDYHDVGLTVH